MSPHIVVAYDFTPMAERALTWAAELRRTVGATLRLVHVMSPVASQPEHGMLPAPTDSEVEAVRERLREVLARHGVDGEIELTVSSRPGPALVASAERHRADLVALGTHGRGAVARAFVGSVADHLLRHAPCPVVTVR